MKMKIKTKKKKKKGVHTGALKHESDGVAAIVSLDGDDVIVASTLEHLRHVVKVHTHGKVTVTAVVLKALRSKQQSHQRHVA